MKIVMVTSLACFILRMGCSKKVGKNADIMKKDGVLLITLGQFILADWLTTLKFLD